MRVVVAPDKFKGSATAGEAAAALAAGLRRARPDAEVVRLPVADGGEGTVAAALAAGFRPAKVTAEGPDGRPVQATFAIRDRTAVIELASVAGLRLLARPAPLTASTFGVGQVIAAALDAGAREIVLGLGGSASTDGGAGLIQALGARLTGVGGRPLGRGGAALAGLARVDLAALRRPASLLVACDVDNPLLGPAGAAAVFAPQKGAGPQQVAVLERALARWAELTRVVTGRDVAGAPGAGAAGGTGFAVLAYLGARLVPGIDLVLEIVGFDAVASGARLVVTGEGSLDSQTLRGKAPLGVARAAARLGVDVVAVAGRVRLSPAEIASAGFARAYSLEDLAPRASVSRAVELLERTGGMIAEDLLTGQ